MAVSNVWLAVRIMKLPIKEAMQWHVIFMAACNMKGHVARIYVNVCVCVLIDIYIYIYIHTHTHTHTHIKLFYSKQEHSKTKLFSL